MSTIGQGLVRQLSQVIAALAVVVLLFVGGAAPAAAESPAEYRQMVRAALADLESGRQDGARRAAARLRTFGPVTLPDGTTVQPDNRAILVALEARPADVATALAGLRALLAELDRTSAAGAPWPGDPRGRLQQVLERPEFRLTPPNPLTSFLQRLWETVLDWLGRALGPVGGWLAEQAMRLPGGGLIGQIGRPAMIAIGLLVVGGLVFWVTRGLRQTMGPGVAAVPTEPTAAPMTAAAARAEAERLARDGAFRAAIRSLYLAALLYWDEQGRLRFDRTLTNREALARVSVQGDAALAERLAPLVERFDRFWYGGVPCSPADYAEFARLAARAWETA